MKHIHINNHISSKKPLQDSANEVLTQILENKDGIFTISVDDGDGDLYKYEIHVYCDRVKNITQPLTEN
jgi:1,4-alpha-glucan branching enzyme